MCVEKQLPFDKALVADTIEETFAHMSLCIRYTGNLLSIYDAWVEGKYSFWMLNNPTAPGKDTDKKGRNTIFWASRRKSQPTESSNFQWLLELYQLHSDPSRFPRKFPSSLQLCSLTGYLLLSGVFPLAQDCSTSKPLTEHHMKYPCNKKSSKAPSITECVNSNTSTQKETTTATDAAYSVLCTLAYISYYGRLIPQMEGHPQPCPCNKVWYYMAEISMSILFSTHIWLLKPLIMHSVFLACPGFPFWVPRLGKRSDVVRTFQRVDHFNIGE